MCVAELFVIVARHSYDSFKTLVTVPLYSHICRKIVTSRLLLFSMQSRDSRSTFLRLSHFGRIRFAVIMRRQNSVDLRWIRDVSVTHAITLRGL